jgi:hypothetical protein
VCVDGWPRAGGHGTTPVLALVKRVQTWCCSMIAALSVASAVTSYPSEGCGRSVGMPTRWALMSLSAVLTPTGCVFLGTSLATRALSPVRMIPCWLHRRHVRSSSHSARTTSVDACGCGERLCSQMGPFRALTRSSPPASPVRRDVGGCAGPTLCCCLILALVSLDLQVRLTANWLA